MAMLTWVSYSLECDECYEQFDGGDEDEPDKLIADAQEGGWTVDEQQDYVYATCPECSDAGGDDV